MKTVTIETAARAATKVAAAAAAKAAAAEAATWPGHCTEREER